MRATKDASEQEGVGSARSDAALVPTAKGSDRARAQRPSARRSQTSQIGWLAFYVVVFVAYAVACVSGFYYAGSPQGSRVVAHEWLGLGLGLAFAIHLASHRSWLVALTKSFTKPLKRRVRVSYLLDVALLLLFTIAGISGLMLSGMLAGAPRADGAWRGAHHLSTKLTIVLLLWHVLRHRHWLVTAWRRIFRARIPTRVGRRARVC